MKFFTKSVFAVDYSKRLMSLDVFRGLVIAAMILVNNPGSPDHIFSELRHAKWHGCTFADLVFPFFLWISGLSMFLTSGFTNTTSLIERKTKRHNLLIRMLKRSVILFAIGLFINGFPFGLIAGHEFSLTTIRILGVLQRIAICTLFSSLIFLYSKAAWQIFWTVFLLVSYWLIMKFVVIPGYGAGILEPLGNVAWYIDSIILKDHTYKGAQVYGFDPEGLLSTLPAIASMMTGVLSGYIVTSRNSNVVKSYLLLISGCVPTLLGVFTANYLPINKQLWTTSYTLFTSGLAAIIFACIYWLAEVKKYQAWCKPLQIYGTSSLAIYIVSILILRLTNVIKINSIDGNMISIKNYYYQTLFTQFGDGQVSSALHAIAFVFFMYILACLRHKLGNYQRMS